MTEKAAAKTTHAPSGNAHSTLGTLGLDLLDTTWRIIVPVLLFAGTGIFADRKADSAPWFTLLGVVLGFVVAGLLIKKQLARVEREDKS